MPDELIAPHVTHQNRPPPASFPRQNHVLAADVPRFVTIMTSSRAAFGLRKRAHPGNHRKKSRRDRRSRSLLHCLPEGATKSCAFLRERLKTNRSVRFSAQSCQSRGHNSGFNEHANVCLEFLKNLKPAALRKFHFVFLCV